MKEETLNFDNVFTNDQEVQNELDMLMTDVANEIYNDESVISVMNPKRLKQIEFVYKTMKYIVKGKELKVSYELNQPYTSMGSVSIVGKEIRVTNPALFLRASGFASNLEIYPKTDGTVQMDFTFHNLTRKAGK